MAIVYYITVLAEMLCFIIKQLFYFLFLLFSCAWEKLCILRRLVRYKRYRRLKQPESRRNTDGKKERVVIPHIIMQVNTAGIVGKSKTGFLKESDLPKFNKNEVIFSIPLEKEVADSYEEEPGIDPGDVETASGSSDLIKMLEEENDDPGLYDDAPPAGDDLSMYMATGASLDELGETFDTLRKEEYTVEEKVKAKNVFRKIEGTDFLKFYLMQNESIERAKLFMQEIEAAGQQYNPGNTAFDISWYI